jgi:hypothetical protein
MTGASSSTVGIYRARGGENHPVIDRSPSLDSYASVSESRSSAPGRLARTVKRVIASGVTLGADLDVEHDEIVRELARELRAYSEESAREWAAWWRELWRAVSAELG